MRTGRQCLFVPWHCVDIFAIGAAERSRFYLRVPQLWADFEFATILPTWTPPILAYFTGLAMATATARRVVLDVALVEHAVMAMSLFLRAARDGLFWSPVRDSRIQDAPAGILVEVPSRLCPLVDELGVFQLMDVEGFSVAGYTAHVRSGEIDWAAVREQSNVAASDVYLYYD